MFVFVIDVEKKKQLIDFVEGLHLNKVVNHFFTFVSCISCKLELFISRMERRPTRVSEAQWNILLEFLERNPRLARARGYNNSAQGRAESSRLWQEVANLLNAEGSGTTKTPKDWSVYVSNYKSKLKKIVADINSDASATGGGPPRSSSLSELDKRFLGLMGPGFGQTAPLVSVNPFPDADIQQPSSTPAMSQTLHDTAEDVQHAEIEVVDGANVFNIDSSPNIVEQPIAEDPVSPTPTGTTAPPLPRQTRRTRYRSRPLAPLDEARRILSQVEMQRAAANAASARAQNLMAHNLGRIADAAEAFLSRFRPQ